MAALTFSFTSLTSCEDVPAPYDIPGDDDNPDTPGESSLPYTDANLSDWEAVTPKGAAWSLGSTYAKATGYNGSSYDETEAWLVSPKINLGSATGAVINFDHVIRYAFNESDLNNHEVYISSDYAGDVKTATWTKLGYKPVASSTNSWDFYAANTIAVPQEYLGKEVVVAFKFVCGSSNSTTWEIKNFSITEGNGGDQPNPDQPSTGVAKGDGTQANPFNSVAANQYASSLAADVESDKEVYIQGKVVSVTQKYGDTTYGTATFYISDDGKDDNKFLVFRALYLNNEKYTSGADINVGDEVLVCGKVVNYKGNTPETVTNKAYLAMLTSNGGGNTGGNDNPGGEISENSIKVTPASFDLANGTSVGTQTLADGTQLIFGAGTNKNDPKFYTSGCNIRMYPTNTLTVKSTKKIQSIILYCDTYNGVLCNAEGKVSAQPGTVVVSGEQLNINGINSLETLITNASGITGTASQIRITSIVINYAE